MNSKVSAKILVTGAAGFIGSHFAEWLVQRGWAVTVLDDLTYAGRESHLSSIRSEIQFIKGNINDLALLNELFDSAQFDSIVNFAAETHVDRSIQDATPFISSNIMGVGTLLSAIKEHRRRIKEANSQFRFLQISTDEVFGSLGSEGFFDEQTAYSPSSPYSASKASADHLVQSYFRTFDLPVLIAHLPNNFGPRQFHEKLIPKMVELAISAEPLPLYGSGLNVRDWLPVQESVKALGHVLEFGDVGESYCIAGNCERTNLEVVESICKRLDEVRPLKNGSSYRDQIIFVKDRLGHDWRYAMKDTKLRDKLKYRPSVFDFEFELGQTVDWYLRFFGGKG